MVIEILFAILIYAVNSEIVSLSSNDQVKDGEWMETGVVAVNSFSWTDVTTTNNKWIDPLVFISTPYYTGSDNIDKISYAPRIIKINNEVKFSVKLFFPNGVECYNEWSTPKNSSSYTVGWLVVEKDGYSINDVAQLVVANYTVSTTQTKMIWPYPFGTNCVIDDFSGDDRAPGAIFTIQSLVNDMFLIVRVNPYWFKTSKCNYAWKAGVVFLQTYDGVDTLVQASIQPENLGVFLFDFSRPYSIDCVSGSLFQFSDISSSQLIASYQDMGQVSGIFGGVLTYVGGDSISLKTQLVDSNTYSFTLQVCAVQCMYLCICVCMYVCGPTCCVCA